MSLKQGPVTTPLIRLRLTRPQRATANGQRILLLPTKANRAETQCPVTRQSLSSVNSDHKPTLNRFEQNWVAVPLILVASPIKRSSNGWTLRYNRWEYRILFYTAETIIKYGRPVAGQGNTESRHIHKSSEKPTG